MAQLQTRRKLVEETLQVPVAIQSTSVNQNEIVSEQQSFAMVQSTLQTSVSDTDLTAEACFKTDKGPCPDGDLGLLKVTRNC